MSLSSSSHFTRRILDSKELNLMTFLYGISKHTFPLSPSIWIPNVFTFIAGFLSCPSTALLHLGSLGPWQRLGGGNSLAQGPVFTQAPPWAGIPHCPEVNTMFYKHYCILPPTYSFLVLDSMHASQCSHCCPPPPSTLSPRVYGTAPVSSVTSWLVFFFSALYCNFFRVFSPVHLPTCSPVPFNDLHHATLTVSLWFVLLCSPHCAPVMTGSPPFLPQSSLSQGCAFQSLPWKSCGLVSPP